MEYLTHMEMETLAENGENVVKFYNHVEYSENTGDATNLFVIVRSHGFGGLVDKVSFSEETMKLFSHNISALLTDDTIKAVLGTENPDEFQIIFEFNRQGILVVSGKMKRAEFSETSIFDLRLKFAFELDTLALTHILNLPLIQQYLND